LGKIKRVILIRDGEEKSYRRKDDVIKDLIREYVKRRERER